MSKIRWISIAIVVFVLQELFVPVLRGQNRQEVVVTIEGLSSGDKLAHFYRGEELRKQMKFDRAMEEYKKVISGGELCGKESEAHYDIGLCYLWLMKLDTAEAIFREVIKTYPNDREAVAYSIYCLSWIDVQRGSFRRAIERLQQLIAQNLYSEKEFCARAQFEIGRIYLVFMHDYKQAEMAFRKVLKKYPDTEIINHPFLLKLKKEMD